MMRLIGAILLIGVSQAALAGVYELTFRRVTGANEPERCRAFTEKTAHEFARQSGARVISAGCQADGYSEKGFDSVLTYQASEPVAIISTATNSVYSGAFYSNLETCNQRLALQQELFTRATGLKPLTAYCMIDIGSLGRRWETRVDGIGKSTVEPHAAAVTLYGSLVEGKSVFQSYLDAAQGYGISIFEVGVQQAGLGDHLVVRYYGTDYLYLQDYDDMKYETTNDCASAAAAVKEALQSAAKPVVAFCEKDRGNRSATLHVTAFEPILKPTDVFRAHTLATQYSTLSGCQSATAGVLGEGHDEIFGAVCAGTDRDFRIHLFSRP